jgi:hypothetical protein
MPAELALLLINAAFLAFAYGWAFPSLPEKSLGALLRADLAVAGAALLVVWLIWGGTGTRFSLILFETNWFVFWVLSGMAMEAPLFARFCRRYGIDLSGRG